MPEILGRSPWQRIWSTLHEPRIITAIVVVYYALTCFAGGWLIWIAVRDVASWVPDPIAIAAGAIMFVSGGVGVPTAWRGRWWLERGATALSGLAGGLLMFGTALAMHVHPDAIDRVVAWTSLIGGLAMLQQGLNRWFRVGLDPYAPGAGPLLPERERDLAISRMELAQQEALQRHERTRPRS